MKTTILRYCALCIVHCAFYIASAQSVGLEWHQGDPYNRLCPEIDGQRALVGCVATAATEIMHYYQYPACTLDTLHGWGTDKYVLPDIKPGARIDWHNVLIDYRGQYTEAQADAVARLSLYAGMACRMNYGVNSSGADTWRYVESLPRVFGYRYVNMYDRTYYSPANWRRVLVHELKQGHPLLYTGYNQELGGHAYVVDGYDPLTGLFHAEWGYGGAYNGWFDLDTMNPFERTDDPTAWGHREGLFCNQCALAFAPEECQPLVCDSVKLDVELDSISLPSAMGVGQNSVALFHFTNHGTDTLTYTYEVLSNAPQDTALFLQADYIGLSAVHLPPHTSATDTVLLRIRQHGERLLRVSDDDSTTSRPVAVQIEAKALPCLIEDVELLDVGDTHATFAISQQGTGLVTWCLFPDQSLTPDTDTRHWSVQTDTVTFRHLAPDHEYTLLVRYPWEPKHKIVFRTAKADGVEPPVHSVPSREAYDLLGRPATMNRHGIIIRNNKKIVLSRDNTR